MTILDGINAYAWHNWHKKKSRALVKMLRHPEQSYWYMEKLYYDEHIYDLLYLFTGDKKYTRYYRHNLKHHAPPQ